MFAASGGLLPVFNVYSGTLYRALERFVVSARRLE
jgi:hypothetical protein